MVGETAGSAGAGATSWRDETTLKAVAAATGGTYYAAEDADQLRDVFAKLPSDIQNQHEEHEISVWFVLAGALLVVRRVRPVPSMEPDMSSGTRTGDLYHRTGRLPPSRNRGSRPIRTDEVLSALPQRGHV